MAFFYRIKQILLNLDDPAFWSLLGTHLDAGEGVAGLLGDGTALLHSTWNHDGLLVVVNLSDWGDDSGCSAETDLDEISKLVLVHLALFDFHSEVVFRTRRSERRVIEGRIEFDFGVTSFPSFVTKRMLAPPVSSMYVWVAGSVYMFSA